MTVSKPFSLLCRIMFIATCLASFSVAATTITQVPRGTEFYLNRTIDIPAHHSTLLLGSSGIDNLFNSIGQVGNHNSNNYYYYHGYYWRPHYNYYRYDYFMEPGNFWQTYLGCLKRNTYTYIHPRYRKHRDRQQSNQQVVITGGNNTVVLNDRDRIYDHTVTYAQNCIEPMYTMTFLEFKSSENARVLGPRNSKGEERPLLIKTVKQHDVSYGYEVSLYFQHPVIKRLIILTNHDPQEVYLSHLDKSGDGWSGAFQSMTNIADELFTVRQNSQVEVID